MWFSVYLHPTCALKISQMGSQFISGPIHATGRTPLTGPGLASWSNHWQARLSWRPHQFVPPGGEMNIGKSTIVSLTFFLSHFFSWILQQHHVSVIASALQMRSRSTRDTSSQGHTLSGTHTQQPELKVSLSAPSPELFPLLAIAMTFPPSPSLDRIPRCCWGHIHLGSLLWYLSSFLSNSITTLQRL